MARSSDLIARTTAGHVASAYGRRGRRALAGLLSTAVRVLAGAAVAGAIGGCAFDTPAAISNIRYDLGPQTPPAYSGPLPALRLFDVRAPAALDTDDILYRISYADPRRTASYANSHWTMRPSQLVTVRVRGALAARGAVLSGGEAVNAPLLTIELDQFEQVFDSESESHGALTARATLTRNGALIAQQTFVARAPASMGNAAGGVQALAAASDEFVAQLMAWLGMQAGAVVQ
ncbi:ABC-type transport auxiliary lipoprotein family protein [Trinickia sp.]|uniref:ABC-type transport auxiliary lipoprotein family protein n=1 Tax=Trinickia sp. TaxID=2571163 RepID=UPI003F818B42